MKWLNENKELLKKYLLILIFNIVFFILCDYYIKDNDIQSITLLMIIFVGNLIISNIKEKVVYKRYLDIIMNFILSIILSYIIKDEYIYSITLISLLIPNYIVFMRSRLNKSFFKRSLEYLMTFFLLLLNFTLGIILF